MHVRCASGLSQEALRDAGHEVIHHRTSQRNFEISARFASTAGADAVEIDHCPEMNSTVTHLQQMN